MKNTHRISIPKKSIIAQYTLMLLLAFSSTLSLAHEENKKDNIFKFSEITCWDLLLLTEEERPYALTMVYGYQAGRNGIDLQNGEMITNVLQKTGESCEKDPDKDVLTLMNKILKKM